MTRTVRFGDTDAAGVIHFLQLFRWAHESWEESLEKYGISASEIFPQCDSLIENPRIAFPVINCQAEFRLPIKTGDKLNIQMITQKIDLYSFHVKTIFKRSGKDVAFSLIKHLAINTETRSRCYLPETIDRWLEASSINVGVTSLD
tara:strand:+ start:195 stop:632 length:438 start_codon:yes stop_codon:yes gene_type:complete